MPIGTFIHEPALNMSLSNLRRFVMGLALPCLALMAADRAHAQAVPMCGGGGEIRHSSPTTGLEQPASAPAELLALVEIPAGGTVKYELHLESGRMEVDRFLSMPVAYPVNYGVLPCTLAEDGDLLDVLILTREPVLPGALIRVRPVALLRMLDRGEVDNKVLVVPVTAVDPAYGEIQGLGDVPRSVLDRIEAFFRVYKDLPDPDVSVEVGPWTGLDDALAEVQAALDAVSSR